MNRNKNRLIALLITTALIITGILILSQGKSSQRALTISYKNARDVTVIDITNRQHEGEDEDKVIKAVEKSGETVHVDSSASILVTYKGVSGYQDGFVDGSSEDVVIDPEYSQDRIRQIISSAQSDINSAVFSQIQNSSQYSLDKGTLYDHGTWYISRLIPISPDGELDTLSVLLKNEPNAWVMVESPKLVFTKYNTRNVPADVLDAVNNY